MRETLGNKLMLELTSPSKRAPVETVFKTVDQVAEVVKTLGCVDFLNIPEIIEENHRGDPLYKNLDVLDFATLLREKTSKETVVNKVVAHLKPDEFKNWLETAVLKRGLRHAVFVGGSSSSKKYAGPSVVEANKFATSFNNLRIGNISIPNRKNEVERLLSKTDAGCSFFTTQILFETESIKRLLSEYERECDKKSLEPAAFFLCFAPVNDVIDIEFIKWLGAELPHEVENLFKESGKGMGLASIKLAEELWREIYSYAEENRLRVPLSLNVEPISLRNLQLSREMVETLHGVSH